MPNCSVRKLFVDKGVAVGKGGAHGHPFVPQAKYCAGWKNVPLHFVVGSWPLAGDLGHLELTGGVVGAHWRSRRGDGNARRRAQRCNGVDGVGCLTTVDVGAEHRRR